MSRRLTLGLVQMTASRSVAENVAAASTYIREAAAAGAAFIATPEMTTLMERDPDRARASARAQKDDANLTRFQALAAELGVHLLIGSMPILHEETKRLVNRSFLIGPDGGIVAHYDKLHLFDVSLGSGESYRESRTYKAGDKAILAETDMAGAGNVRVGLSVCYDLRFAYLYRALAQAGAHILTVPAAFTQVTGEAHWHVLLRARAIETGAYLVAPAQTGHHEDGRRTYGHSLVVGPWGDIVADAGCDCGVTCVSIDLDAVPVARTRIPALEHDRTTDVVIMGQSPCTGSGE